MSEFRIFTDFPNRKQQQISELGIKLEFNIMRLTVPTGSRYQYHDLIGHNNFQDYSRILNVEAIFPIGMAYTGFW